MSELRNQGRGEQSEGMKGLCGDGRTQQAKKKKKSRVRMSGGSCALPNQFIPVHQLPLLFAAARPGR